MIELSDLVTINETNDASGIEKSVIDLCHVMDFSLWQDQDLTIPHTEI